MSGAIVVTRHKGLVEYLREINLIDEDTPILPHVSSAEEVIGKTIIGPYPLHIAVAANSIVQVPLDIPSELRGAELSLEQVREYAKKPVEYTVRNTNTGYLTYTARKAAEKRLRKELGVPKGNILDTVAKKWAEEHGLKANIVPSPKEVPPIGLPRGGWTLPVIRALFQAIIRGWQLSNLASLPRAPLEENRKVYWSSKAGPTIRLHLKSRELGRSVHMTFYLDTSSKSGYNEE